MQVDDAHTPVGRFFMATSFVLLAGEEGDLSDRVLDDLTSRASAAAGRLT
jgi:hypothetical protein